MDRPDYLSDEEFKAGWAKARADRPPPEEAKAPVSFDDFVAYMPSHTYIFTPTREMWPASSVDSRLPKVDLGDGKHISASRFLDNNQPVEQMTWSPGQPMLIKDRFVADGGWIEREGGTCFNLYRPPVGRPGNAGRAGMWVDLIGKVYPTDADHILNWLAHRVQRPQEKINHAIVFGGKQGIGKDSILEPVKQAVGPWNFSEVSPTQMLGRFNGFLKSVILRISEARDLGDADRYGFYEHTKPIIAAPPDVLRVDEKNLREHSIFNAVGVVITTNNKTNGIFLPRDDRRHYVAWSDLDRNAFDEAYWTKLWGWYAHAGAGNVAAYLAERDIAGFDPKAPPPQTPAFWEIVDASSSPEDSEMADALDRLNTPDAVTLRQIARRADDDFAAWLMDRKNRRLIPYRLEQCGYVPVRNPHAKDGLWVIDDARQAIYSKQLLSIRERHEAGERLTSTGPTMRTPDF
jgi:hypothetical protein